MPLQKQLSDDFNILDYYFALLLISINYYQYKAILKIREAKSYNFFVLFFIDF